MAITAEVIGQRHSFECAPSANARAGIRAIAGFTLIELLVVIAIIGVVTAIAVPGLLRARMSSSEVATLGSLRAINSAEISYSAGCGNGSFANLLATLRLGPGGSPEGYLSPELALAPIPEKSGYAYALAAGNGAVAGPTDCNGTATTTAYYLTATPITVGVTGNRGFATNQGGAIWQDTTGLAPSEPFTAGPGVSPVQ